jgi:hypothetical protein
MVAFGACATLGFALVSPILPAPLTALLFAGPLRHVLSGAVFAQGVRTPIETTAYRRIACRASRAVLIPGLALGSFIVVVTAYACAVGSFRDTEPARWIGFLAYAAMIPALVKPCETRLQPNDVEKTPVAAVQPD